jgi:flagellar biosynthesis chaperone FliJ
MTQLYKKNGGVFIPINLTLEDVTEAREELSKVTNELQKVKEVLSSLIGEENA